MNDDLDQKTDAELNEIFAVEVAGLRKVPAEDYGADGFWEKVPHPRALVSGGRFTLPFFSTDANAVLPYIHEFGLQKFPGGEPYYFEAKSPICREQGWMLRLMFAHHDGDIVSEQTEAPTFARAACIALIRAKRAEKISP